MKKTKKFIKTLAITVLLWYNNVTLINLLQKSGQGPALLCSYDIKAYERM